MKYEKHLEMAIEAAKNAANVLLSRYKNPGVLGRDRMGVIKSEADDEAEKAILNTLSKNYPDSNILKGHSIIAEESGYHNTSSKGIWIIDPLDGTTNYLNKLQNWGIMIAFSKKNEIKICVISLPMEEILITAMKDNGVYINNNKINQINHKQLKESIVYYDTCADKKIDEANKHIEKYKNHVKKFEESKCSADAFSKLLKGEIDISLEYVATPWDDAAGALAIKEAGGIITDLKGNHWAPEMHISLENKIINDQNGNPWALKTPTVLATINQDLHNQFLKLIQNQK